MPEVDDRRGVVKPLSPEELAKQQRDKDEAYDTFRDLLGEDLAEHNNPAGKRSAEDEGISPSPPSLCLLLVCHRPSLPVFFSVTRNVEL